MENFERKVVVGNLAMYPETLREFLIKSDYSLHYDPETEKLVLHACHGHGDRDLFEIRNVSYESAVRMAEGLGLKSDRDSDTPLIWSKWHPVLHLDHDGSEDAEKVRMEMLRLGVAHNVYYNEPWFALHVKGLIHRSPSWSANQMLDIIREIAERDKDE